MLKKNLFKILLLSSMIIVPSYSYGADNGNNDTELKNTANPTIPVVVNNKNSIEIGVTKNSSPEAKEKVGDYLNNKNTNSVSPDKDVSEMIERGKEIKNSVKKEMPETPSLDSQKDVKNESQEYKKYKTNSNFTDYTLCGDFVTTEKYDNLSDNDPRKNKPEDVQNHVRQLEVLMSPYFVRNKAGQIYPPALSYLIFNTSKICNDNGEMPLINSIRMVAANLADMVKKSNEEAKKEINSN